MVLNELWYIVIVNLERCAVESECAFVCVRLCSVLVLCMRVCRKIVVGNVGFNLVDGVIVPSRQGLRCLGV